MPSFQDETTLDAGPRAADPQTSASGDSNLGRRIGHYRVERLIARGGMGRVYLARREDDYEQKVALKLFDRKPDNLEVLDRFFRERQILARLEHPNISRILDGGNTDDGLPFFVMEYVEGVPVDRYCNDRRLDLRRRIELFQEICRVVHAAHRSLIVHRDLKPSNILVTSDGVPKLLDFGIAKILDLDSDAPSWTRTGEGPLTPAYASPEQLLGKPITTSSDVYSLGVLLYELSSGRHPFADLPADPVRILREICEEGPPPPSARAAERLARQLAGDIDAIVMKAMRRDPEQRYPSILELAEDLRRHLAGVPVLAYPGTWRQRAWKRARRHRLALAVLLAGLALAATTTVLWQRSVHDQQTTQTALRQAEAARADSEAALARLLHAQGRPQEARPHFEKALELELALVGEDHVDTATTRTGLAAVLLDEGETDAAQALLETALATLRRERPAGDAAIAEAQCVQGGVLAARGRYAEAELHLLGAYQVLRDARGDDDVATLDARRRLVRLYETWGRPDKAASLGGETVVDR